MLNWPIMAFTQSDLDQLEQAIKDGRGAKSIAFDDQTVVFHSIDEMLRLRAVMKRDVNSTSNHRLAVTSKGT